MCPNVPALVTQSTLFNYELKIAFSISEKMYVALGEEKPF